MSRCMLIHDRDVPFEIFRPEVRFNSMLPLSSRISVSAAQEMLADAIRDRGLQTDVIIVSVSSRLQENFKKVLFQLKENESLPAVVVVNAGPFFYAPPFPVCNFKIFEATVWPSDPEIEDHSFIYYTTPKLDGFVENSAVLENMFNESYQLDSKFGTATILRALKTGLLAMELVGLKFVINASKLLDIEPSIMLDILRHASARSIVSMTKIGEYLQNDLAGSVSALAGLLKLSSCLQYPAALMSSCLSMLEEWQAVVQSLGDLQGLPNSSVVHCRSSKADKSCDSKRILVVGLGAMGLGMATSLKNSFPVIGCDISPCRLDEARRSLLSVTDDIESCLDDIDVLLFVVETPGQVLDIIQKVSRQLVSRYRPLTIILHTTMSASSAIQVSEQLWHLNSDIMCLEAPISGGPVRAQRGELLIIVAGEKATMDRQVAVLEQMSSRLYYAGNIGNASKVKALHQVSAAINHVSSFEITCLGLAYGIDSGLLKDVLTKHAYNQYLADRLPKFLAWNRTPDARLSIWLKDLRIAEEQLVGVGMDTSIVGILLSLFKEASEKGSPSDSDICIARCWQEWEIETGLYRTNAFTF